MSTVESCVTLEDGVLSCTTSTIRPTTSIDANPGISKPGEVPVTTPGGKPGGKPGVAPSSTAALTLTATSTSTSEPGTGVQNTIDTPAAETGTPSPNVSHAGGSQGVSKGAVAGIAIATAVVGAAIALLAAFFLLKRRRRSSSPYSDYTPELISNMNAKENTYVQVSQSSAPPPAIAAAAVATRQDLDLANLSNSSDFLAGILAPAADDQAVAGKVAGLFGRFQRHVDNFYRDVHNTITPTMEADLARFGSGLVEILDSSSKPTIAIKHALATYILSIVNPEEEDQATLFPAEITGLKKNERSPDPDDQAAYILYKRLAVHLHNPNTTSLQSRQSDIREAAEHFALTFFPWANPAYHEQEKDEELIQIISDALDVSVWLYGQSYIYEFVWEGVGRRGTVVAPGVAKLTDERGRIRERPQVLLEPAVAAS